MDFAKKVDFYIYKTNMSIEKFDSGRLETERIAITLFPVDDIDRKLRYFQKTFLLSDISMNITFEISFSILRNVKINFNNQKLNWKSYITTKIFFITK